MSTLQCQDSLVVCHSFKAEEGTEHRHSRLKEGQYLAASECPGDTLVLPTLQSTWSVRKQSGAICPSPHISTGVCRHCRLHIWPEFPLQVCQHSVTYGMGSARSLFNVFFLFLFLHNYYFLVLLLWQTTRQKEDLRKEGFTLVHSCRAQTSER